MPPDWRDGYIAGVWSTMFAETRGRPYVSINAHRLAVGLVSTTDARLVYREMAKRLSSFHDLDVPGLR